MAESKEPFDYACGNCGKQFSCRCWEQEAATYRPQEIANGIKLDELRDRVYGIGRNR